MIAAGLTLRLVHLGLPGFLVKYGGSTLWGGMVYFVVATLLPAKGRATVAFCASMIATATELSRLFHTPWLDGFRLTLAGALLLGRVFSPWNVVAYLLGIAAAAGVDRLLIRDETRSARHQDAPATR